MNVDGWVERWTPADGRLIVLLNRARALRAAGYDVACIVAADYSHVVMVVCDAQRLTVIDPAVAWVEPGGQLPLFERAG